MNFPKFLLCLFFTVSTVAAADAQNLSCYQCERTTESECGENDLRPCRNVADRCVIHLKKDRSGFLLRRECGLGPCNFDDDMASKSLGWGNCDRSKDSYFCVFCCKGNGCNKSSAQLSTPKLAMIVISLLVIILLEIFKGFQPPYTPERQFK